MSAADKFPPAPSYGDAPQYPIESVDNALRVLLLISARSPLRVTDVSQYLGVASSSAHRLLSMLQYRGFIRQDSATRSYLAGPTMDRLAFRVLREMDVRAKVHPVVEQINKSLLETVHVGQLVGDEVQFIDSMESPRVLRVGTRLGMYMPAHCTSTGKALLAELTDQEVLRLYPDEKLVQMTPRSISTRTELLEALVKVRADGYARAREESEDGVASLAMAVKGVREPRLAINVSVPVSRVDRKLQQQIVQQLRAATKEVEASLS